MAGRWLLLASLPVLLAGISDVVRAQSDGEAILNARCAACHERTAEGGLARIKDQRKTPEAWDMTIVRMMQLHGVEVTDDERVDPGQAPGRHPGPGARRDGRLSLHPRARALGDRGAADRRARHHVRALPLLRAGRAAAAHRGGVAQARPFPSRPVPHDRVPGARARSQLVGDRIREVAARARRALPAGNARMDTPGRSASRSICPASGASSGAIPRAGDYEGVATIESTGDDTYSVAIEATYADGQQIDGEGSGIVYTGFEWRSRITLGDDETLQVFAVSEDGDTMTGRSFLADAEFDRQAGDGDADGRGHQRHAGGIAAASARRRDRGDRHPRPRARRRRQPRRGRHDRGGRRARCRDRGGAGERRRRRRQRRAHGERRRRRCATGCSRCTRRSTS